MEYKTIKTNASGLGLLTGIVVFGFFIWGIHYALGPDEVLLRTMLLIPTYLGLVIYCILLLGSLILVYSTDEKGLTVRWGFSKKKIFWNQIEEIIRVEGEANFFSIFGGGWRGYMAGLYHVKGIGPVRMYATKTEEGFLYIKTKQGFYGLTPQEQNLMAETIAKETNLVISTINMKALPEEVKGVSYKEDSFYNLLYKINLVFIVGYALYLAVFFPGSGLNRFVILLLVLALALFFFNVSNAKRLYHFSSGGGYFLLVLSIAITGLFFILSFGEISLR